MEKADLLHDLARHQAWADRTHWKALRENDTLLGDVAIRKCLNHMVRALRMLMARAQGAVPDSAEIPDIATAGELEAAMADGNALLIETLHTIDRERMIALPQGPQGPWEAPAGVLLLQAVMHGQHHRGQNALRMRNLGATPPMTDFAFWYALGQP